MDAECSQLLPHVCGVLVDNRQLIVDESIYEKLLDWFTCLLETVSADDLLIENPCIPGLIQQVLAIADADHSLLVFTMRLVGVLAAQAEGFKYLMSDNVIQDLFGDCIYTSDTWKDASIRRAWIQGLLCMAQHQEALHFMHTGGILETMLNLQMDSSLFVASSVNDLIAHVFLMCVKLTGHSSIVHISDLPGMALQILGHLEKLLSSGAHQSITQSLKALTTIFRDCTDSMAEVLWPRILELVNSLLKQKTSHAAPHLEELLLVLTRFPLLCNPEHNLWMVMKHALESLNPVQGGSLAFGILKSKSCPQDVCLQAVCLLLQPLDCVLRGSSTDISPPGFLDELVSEPAVMENLLSKKSSCVSLLCQSLSHLSELCAQGCLTMQLPCISILSAVLLILSFCIGQVRCSSPAGLHLGRSLIGSLRVQRSALDAIGGFTCWPLSADNLKTTYNVLTAYLENPETDPTVLKKAFQASAKWVLAWHTSGEHWAECRTFLQGLCPVIMKRLCSPSWEVRDTTLEFITHITAALTEGHNGVAQVLSNGGVPHFVLDLLKDPESYVRASAVTCMGEITSNTRTAGSPTCQDLVPTLMDILGKDTEGFPRRAVVKVFTHWLKKGQMQNLQDWEPLLSQILEMSCSDLDWEVKINALDIADVYISQILDIGVSQSCPYTVGLPSSRSTLSITDALVKCERMGLLQALLTCLCDCDRPVALKACEILLTMKPALCNGDNPSSTLHGQDWLEHVMTEQRMTCQAGGQQSEWATGVLKMINLENMKCFLSKSSDYLHESPLSLLQDIKATLWGGEMHDADCY